MMVSVVICTRNRRTELVETLRALEQLEIPGGRTAELVLVDNGSTDGTADVIHGHTWRGGAVQALHEPRPGKGHAYNRAIAGARGDVLLLTDDDVRPPPRWLATVCDAIWSDRADMVAGGVRFAPHLYRDWMDPSLRALLSSTELLDAIEPQWVVAANLAFSRRVLAKVPGFDPELGPGALGFEDETLFALQAREAGFRLIGEFDPPVEHWFDERRLATRPLIDYMRRHGRSEAYVDYHWRHRELLHPRLALLRARARWALFLARRPSEWRRREGISDQAAELVSAVGYAEQYLIEQRRPRMYAPRGLVKRPGD